MLKAKHPNLKAVMDDFAAFMVDYKKVGKHVV